MPVATVNLASSKNQVDIPEGISRTVNSLYKTSTSQGHLKSKSEYALHKSKYTPDKSSSKMLPDSKAHNDDLIDKLMISSRPEK